MAGFLSNFFGTDEAEYEDQNNQVPTTTNSDKVISMAGHQAAATSSKISIYQPRLYSDVQEIADELLAHRAAVVNFSQMDTATANKVIDFLNGTVYAIDGAIKRVGEQIFLCTPHNFEVEGNIKFGNQQSENDSLN